MPGARRSVDGPAPRTRAPRQGPRTRARRRLARRRLAPTPTPCRSSCSEHGSVCRDIAAMVRAVVPGSAPRLVCAKNDDDFSTERELSSADAHKALDLAARALRAPGRLRGSRGGSRRDPPVVSTARRGATRRPPDCALSPDCAAVESCARGEPADVPRPPLAFPGGRNVCERARAYSQAIVGEKTVPDFGGGGFAYDSFVGCTERGGGRHWATILEPGVAVWTSVTGLEHGASGI